MLLSNDQDLIRRARYLSTQARQRAEHYEHTEIGFNYRLSKGEDIEARRLWKPMHLQPVFGSSRSFVNGESERLFDRGVTLPSGSALEDDEIDRVIKVLHTALRVD